MKLTIGHLYPDLLNLYGDRGNIQSMKKRCEWRGIEAVVEEIHLSDPVDFARYDLILLGGGADREQKLVCERLKGVREELKSYIEDGGGLLAVCGGYELLGQFSETESGRLEGLALLEMHAVWGESRLISNVIVESPAFTMPVVGFENHGGRMSIGENEPLGRVLFGNGNNGQDGTEGVLYKNVIGTYLHGPLLPKNPEVCDRLLARALERRYGTAELMPLDDTPEMEANRYIVERFGNKK